MKKNVITTLVIIGIVGALLSIVLSIASIVGNELPKWLYLVVSVGMAANVAGLILNYRELKKNKEKEVSEQQ